jgi:hypothetical protein
MTSHVITIHYHGVFTFKPPHPPSTKQQKRQEKKRRKRKRDYHMLARARSVLKREHNLSNHETSNIHTLLPTLKERHLSSRTHKSPPPKSSTITPRARSLQDPTVPRPTANHPSHITKKRRTQQIETTPRTRNTALRPKL